MAVTGPKRGRDEKYGTVKYNFGLPTNPPKKYLQKHTFPGNPKGVSVTDGTLFEKLKNHGFYPPERLSGGPFGGVFWSVSELTAWIRDRPLNFCSRNGPSIFYIEQDVFWPIKMQVFPVFESQPFEPFCVTRHTQSYINRFSGRDLRKRFDKRPFEVGFGYN